MSKLFRYSRMIGAMFAAVTSLGCDDGGVTGLNQLADQRFGVPIGTIADQLVRSKFPSAKFQYYPTVDDAALAVKRGEVAAAAYDEPILRNIAAKDGALRVLPERITTDDYGFGFRLGDTSTRDAFEATVREMKANGDFQKLLDRWLPTAGAPAPMPVIGTASGAVLRFGTAAVTEPFSFRTSGNAVVGLDIELAARTALRMGRRLEIMEMPFGALIPALAANQVDMIGACITITDARKQVVLFSSAYYTGGISALVKR